MHLERGRFSKRKGHVKGDIHHWQEPTNGEIHGKKVPFN
jgi:hypothetical protein